MFLDRFAVITAGSVACDFTLTVSDEGLLASAIARPQTTVFGLDAYPSAFDKAAALMHSIANNHPFLDGNKRTAWASAWLFLAINRAVEMNALAELDVDAAETFVLAVAADQLKWRQISAGLRGIADA